MKRFGIHYVEASIVKDNQSVYLDRSSAYLECEPLFASGLIALVDHPVMARELVILERRPGQSGKDRIDHPKNKHDDFANVLALAAAIAARGSVGKSGAGEVIVHTRPMVPLKVVAERLRQQTSKLSEPSDTWVDPRGADPDAPPPRERDPNPWGRTAPWGVRA